MDTLTIWGKVTIAAMALFAVVTLLGIWGVINGITALKIYLTMLFVALVVRFAKLLIEGPLRVSQPE